MTADIYLELALAHPLHISLYVYTIHNAERGASHVLSVNAAYWARQRKAGMRLHRRQDMDMDNTQ